MKKLSIPVLMCLCAAGCVESTTNDAMKCNCTFDQTCENGVCLDTCAPSRPCPNDLTCVNNVCRVDQTTKCDVGTKRCSDDMTRVLICNDNQEFVTDQECGEGNICDSAICIPEDCEENTKRCHNNNVEICKNNTYRVYTECELPSVCDETKMDCVTADVCADGVKQCGTDGNVQICNNGQWTQLKMCSESAPCNPATTKCANDVDSCEDGTQSCADNDYLMICEGGEWTRTRCESNKVCYEDDCREKCEVNASNCTSDKLYRKCNIFGIWENGGCASGQICNDTSGTAVCEGTCTEGSYSCDGNVLKKCELHEIITIQSCEASETCSESEGRCVPKCGNKQLDNGEACDTTVPAAKTCASEKGDGYTGTLSCTSSCTIDTSGCELKCGNKRLESGEDCDTTVPASKTCATEKGDGYTGTLSCTSSCTIDTSDCVRNCGNGHLDNGEACDTTVPEDKTCATEKGDGYTGTLSCTSSCTIDTSQCKKSSVTPPDGDWDYIQIFDNIRSVSIQYKTKNQFEENGIAWEIIGRTQMTQTNNGLTTDYSIDGKGVILKYDKDTKNYIKATGLTKGIKTLAFDYRSWGTSNDSGTIKITAGDFSEEFDFQNDKTSQEIYSATVNSAATGFTIESTKGGRIIIDNVRWTNQ